MEKTVLLKKIQVLTPKTRFARGKLYFTSEIVFYSGNLSFSAEKLSLSPVFSNGKDRFIRKIQGLTPKTTFSRGTEYFTCEIVFYSGNIIFLEKILWQSRIFSSGKCRFVRKIQVLTAKTRFSHRKCTLHLK